MASSSLLLGALLVAVMAAPAAATVFSNPAAITIPASGQASLYPSTITVSGLTGTIVDVNVTLTGFNHTWPDDVDVLLDAPFGQDVVLMADAGGSTDAVSVNLTFDDAAASLLANAGPTVSGTFRPSNFEGFNGTAPAPAGPYGSTLSVLNGTAPNGTWRLYVYDDTGGDSGSISGGWSVDIVTNGPTITSFTPTSGGPGATVTITGTNFTGATSVTFGGASALFTVNSATQITATVPSNAVTGPIAVTTPNGTATSSSNFTVIPAPVITSFTPTSGQVGTVVVITGTTFTGATAVAFDGVPATTFTVDSATQITVTVPAGATTGPLTVTTASGTGTSATNFVVQHARSVSLNVGRKAKGTVTVTDGYGPCASSVPVKLQHFENGRWRAAGSDLTSAGGAYSIGGTSDPGKYRAIAKKVTLSSGDVCLKDVSPVDRK